MPTIFYSISWIMEHEEKTKGECCGSRKDIELGLRKLALRPTASASKKPFITKDNHLHQK